MANPLAQYLTEEGSYTPAQQARIEADRALSEERVKLHEWFERWKWRMYMLCNPFSVPRVYRLTRVYREARAAERAAINAIPRLHIHAPR